MRGLLEILKPWDDIIYLGLLLVSIGFGKITRQIQDKELRKWTSSMGGLLVVMIVSGWSTLHPLASVIFHTILIKISPKHLVHWINFVLGFAYLIFFRLCGSSVLGYVNTIVEFLVIIYDKSKQTVCIMLRKGLFWLLQFCALVILRL